MTDKADKADQADRVRSRAVWFRRARPIAAAAAAAWMLGTGGFLRGGIPAPFAVASAPSKCADPEHRRLDFWIGDWDAFDAAAPGPPAAAGPPAARVKIERILGGCALRETYQGANGLTGESLTTYDASRRIWHQTWVTDRGDLLQVDGRFDGPSLTLEGTRLDARGREEKVRGVWTPQDAGPEKTVRETAHVSGDGGRTWRPWFDIIFRRHVLRGTPKIR